MYFHPGLGLSGEMHPAQVYSVYFHPGLGLSEAPARPVIFSLFILLLLLLYMISTHE